MKTATPPTLSPTMLDALRVIVAEYDAAVLNEKTRWGGELKGGVTAHDGRNGYRTVHALIDRGMLTFETARTEAEWLRKGSWGKRLGGTHRRVLVTLIVKPTDAARAALETK